MYGFAQVENLSVCEPQMFTSVTQGSCARESLKPECFAGWQSSALACCGDVLLVSEGRRGEEKAEHHSSALLADRSCPPIKSVAPNP